MQGSVRPFLSLAHHPQVLQLQPLGIKNPVKSRAFFGACVCCLGPWGTLTTGWGPLHGISQGMRLSMAVLATMGLLFRLRRVRLQLTHAHSLPVRMQASTR